MMILNRLRESTLLKDYVVSLCSIWYCLEQQFLHKLMYVHSDILGCIGSQDATHVGMLMWQAGLKQYNHSFKLPHPSHSYNATVNHGRKILYTTHGHPGRWNDNSIVMYDKLACGLLYYNV